MRKFILFTGILFCFTSKVSAQHPDCDAVKNPRKPKPYTMAQAIEHSNLVFEGRILSDSVFSPPLAGRIDTVRVVLVLKQFKGEFNSDTLLITDRKMGKKDDEAIFFASHEIVYMLRITNDKLYSLVCGNNCGFINIRDKKDVVNDLYEPIEAITGTPVKVIRLNSLEAEKKQK